MYDIPRDSNKATCSLTHRRRFNDLYAFRQGSEQGQQGGQVTCVSGRGVLGLFGDELRFQESLSTTRGYGLRHKAGSKAHVKKPPSPQGILLQDEQDPVSGLAKVERTSPSEIPQDIAWRTFQTLWRPRPRDVGDLAERSPRPLRNDQSALDRAPFVRRRAKNLGEAVRRLQSRSSTRPAPTRRCHAGTPTSSGRKRNCLPINFSRILYAADRHERFERWHRRRGESPRLSLAAAALFAGPDLTAGSSGSADIRQLKDAVSDRITYWSSACLLHSDGAPSRFAEEVVLWTRRSSALRSSRCRHDGVQHHAA
jgi:hypothetical protein